MENNKNNVANNVAKKSPQEKTAELILASLATENSPLYANHYDGLAQNVNPTTGVVYKGVNDLLLSMKVNMET